MNEKKHTIFIYQEDLKRIHSHKQLRLNRKIGQNYYETLSDVIARGIDFLEREENER